jgi:prepilin-type N-terminal cleavage/methylation domain-containing protein
VVKECKFNVLTYFIIICMMKKFKAFTLVELLIVMGILAILMTIGISVGRFAIQRANNIQHQSAADQIGQAIQAFYSDNRRYPTDLLDGQASPDADDSPLKPYIDASFDGGSEASFHYDTTTTAQSYLICVSYGGIDDTDELGFYCTGDGFEDDNVFGGGIANKEIEFGSAEWDVLDALAGTGMDWDGASW